MKPKDSFWNQKIPQLKTGIGHYKLIERIRDDVATTGHSNFCPDWSSNWCNSFSPCRTCEKLFPRIKKEFTKETNVNVCPCYSSYTKTHLVRVLNMVLRQNKQFKEELDEA